MSAAEEIYSALIAPIEERMMRTVGRLVRDPEEAADVFQNALAQIWRDLKKIHRHPNPQAYILRLCVSVSYDALRRRARRRRWEVPLEGQEPVSPSDDPSTSLRALEERDGLLAAIAGLPGHQAQAILLRVMEEQSFAAIAQALGCSEPTARSHVSKGKQRLREILSRPAAPPVKEEIS